MATTDSQMTLFLMGMQSGKLGAERMKKNIMEEQEYWHFVAYFFLTIMWFQFTSRQLWWIPNLILVWQSFHYQAALSLKSQIQLDMQGDINWV